MKSKKKKIKTRAELETEVAAQQIQSKRYHEKIRESAKVYKRQDTKKEAGELIASEKSDPTPRGVSSQLKKTTSSP